ncbi:MAG: FAD-binding oxidoreductase, partial [Gammaproteobacteria bacterium]
MAIPPGVSERDFNTALGEFERAVGADWVFSDDADTRLYRDSYSPVQNEPEEILVSAAVAPETTEQVQAIVRTANRYRIPIYPVSTGRNLGYGGSAPNLSGSVVLDLKRMNRIIEVDDKRHFAIVEPGVSYFDLYRHIQDHGLNVWIDTPDPGWGSPMGNALDHGVGYTWGTYRDHFLSHCGMEVVLPNGELMRTGMGALPGAETWGEYRYGFGPHVDGLFSQGNFGVVTKMGFHLMPQPEAYLSGTVTVPRRNDIIDLVAIVNKLEHLGIIGMPNYGSPLQAHFATPALAEILQQPFA